MTRNKRAKHDYISFFKPWPETSALVSALGWKMQLITHNALDQKISLFRRLSNQ